MNTTKPLKVTPSELRELEELVRKRTARAGHVRRARVGLLAAQVVSGAEISRRLSLTPPRVSAIRKRFERGGVAGLADQPRAGRKDHAVTPEQVERIVALALSPPPTGYSRWSSRLIRARVKLTSATVAKVLRANDLKPHLAGTFKISRDPDFAAKVRDVSRALESKPDSLHLDQEASWAHPRPPPHACPDLTCSALGAGYRPRREFFEPPSRPPLALALDRLIENFSLGEAE